MQSNTKLVKYSKIIANRLKAYSNQTRFIEIKTAFELNNEQKQRIEKTIINRFGDERPIKFIVDPSLIGGVSLKINLEIIDSSLKTKLNQIINIKEKEGA
ncbi:F0F1 ATP synthase subunit delta [Ureaplasma urealyticum]|uniref:F0F1 ATP synthase subunit delta n=2 Tax=Ureaplasma urealyticum TaxID=2130 RepID=A0AAP9ABM6_UREUR|nr:F0F1 ATP synthase subunit delta [Ureaplasma urealyticum]EDX53827.1 ATP synthase delta subunit domain protein [Ureaplasma urealyticum serovar 9 str. ATCC 33175]EDT49867.1 ATP synthase delta subunit domain protein [Ureaplasma urealyticum serovar 13 str. ATCC 33698]EDU06501.1 ATP synthase delta subunit domain protein [Ureaplasma urealyticum serovar 5 str. ATCC 27817]EDU57034.1 ATP synthase delta subunit domain protein [Ureaplasma urealyticum serovar 7 str. ATCC 27819]EDU67046.1 ATP synthase de